MQYRFKCATNVPPVPPVSPVSPVPLETLESPKHQITIKAPKTTLNFLLIFSDISSIFVNAAFYRKVLYSTDKTIFNPNVY